MTYALPLAERQRYARNKRERYWRDPDYRLNCINRTRARAGLPLLAGLAEGCMVERDGRGRFVRA